ncbi:MAG: hypothetical protein K0S56_2236, partial [Microvirga sp.]|nr:hypothetical protein [Microvirga sp.]
ALGEPATQARCVIGSIGQQLMAGSANGEKRPGATEVMGVSRRQDECDGPAPIIAQRVDFGRPPAARGANGMMTSPPFAPAAERWTLMWVESTAPINTPVEPVRA